MTNQKGTRMKIRTAFLLVAFVAMSGCASLVDTERETVSINTTPTNAHCNVARNGQRIAEIVSTPGIAVINKTKDPIDVHCVMMNYTPTDVTVQSGLDPWIWGNIPFFGGPLGAGVDYWSDAYNYYETPINITLEKIQPAPAPATAP
jgi:hypothetical protein